MRGFPFDGANEVLAGIQDFFGGNAEMALNALRALGGILLALVVALGAFAGVNSGALPGSSNTPSINSSQNPGQGSSNEPGKGGEEKPSSAFDAIKDDYAVQGNYAVGAYFLPNQMSADGPSGIVANVFLDRAFASTITDSSFTLTLDGKPAMVRPGLDDASAPYVHAIEGGVLSENKESVQYTVVHTYKDAQGKSQTKTLSGTVKLHVPAGVA